MDDENLDEIINSHTSESDINSALIEKDAGEFTEEDAGELTKDYPSPQREIDLHLMTGAEARSEISSFIYSSNKQNLLTVRIVTGKGTGKLIQETEKLLSELKNEGQIIRFQKEKTGGSFVVYL